MKKTLKYAISLLLLAGGFWSCSEEKLDPTSVFVDGPKRDTDFDHYLTRNFLVPYNVEVQYWMDFKSSDQSYVLTPPKVESAKIMTVLLKHLWFDAYAEASADGVAFVRQTATRVIQLYGSPMWQTTTTVIMGQAAQGKMLRMYAINTLDPNDSSTYTPESLLGTDPYGSAYIYTLTHEFAHILHQTKNYPDTFEPISTADYVGETAWNDRAPADALNLGFITPYGGSQVDEDFVEIISMYLTRTPAQWEAHIAGASDSGKAKIAQKLAIIKAWFSSAWSIDMENLRTIILRRASEVPQLEVVDLK